MTSNRIAQLVARTLMGLGLAVGTLAVAVWVFDVRIEIPAWMWRVAVAKLTLAGGLGLLVVGAALLRHLRRTEDRANSAVPGRTPDESLPAPNWTATPISRERDPVLRTPKTPRTP